MRTEVFERRGGGVWAPHTQSSRSSSLAMDAKDILGLPKNSISAAPQEKRPRPPKESQRKPDGVSREVLPLLTSASCLSMALSVCLSLSVISSPPSLSRYLVHSRSPFVLVDLRDNLLNIGGSRFMRSREGWRRRSCPPSMFRSWKGSRSKPKRR